LCSVSHVVIEVVPEKGRPTRRVTDQPHSAS
jgi:hypothetical protein